MPAHDFYHDVVKAALIADGWTIHNDPLRSACGQEGSLRRPRRGAVARRRQGGPEDRRRVESFLGASEVADLEHALGQCILYEAILEQNDPDRLVYLAVHEEIHEELFQEPIGQILLKHQRLRLIVFDPEKGRIVQWVPE